MSVEAREPRKIRRAKTRVAYWDRLRASARTPADRAHVSLQQLRAALARTDVTDKQRDRAWAELGAVADRLVASVTPRDFTREVHSAEFTAGERPNAQTGAPARAREPQPADYSKSPTGGHW